MKLIAQAPVIEIREDGGKWVDISDLIYRYELVAEVGEPYIFSLHLHETERIRIDLKESVRPRPSASLVLNEGGSIAIEGVDIADLVRSVTTVKGAHDLHRVVLEVFADPERLRISGETPWG